MTTFQSQVIAGKSLESDNEKLSTFSSIKSNVLGKLTSNVSSFTTSIHVHLSLYLHFIDYECMILSLFSTGALRVFVGKAHTIPTHPPSLYDQLRLPLNLRISLLIQKFSILWHPSRQYQFECTYLLNVSFLSFQSLS